MLALPLRAALPSSASLLLCVCVCGRLLLHVCRRNSLCSKRWTVMSSVDLKGVESIEGEFCGVVQWLQIRTRWNCGFFSHIINLQCTVRIQEESSNQLKSHGRAFLHCTLYYCCAALCYSWVTTTPWSCHWGFVPSLYRFPDIEFCNDVWIEHNFTEGVYFKCAWLWKRFWASPSNP